MGHKHVCIFIIKCIRLYRDLAESLAAVLHTPYKVKPTSFVHHSVTYLSKFLTKMACTISGLTYTCMYSINKLALTWCRRHNQHKTIKNKRTKEQRKQYVCEAVFYCDMSYIFYAEKKPIYCRCCKQRTQ